MKSEAKDFEFTKEEIVAAATTWANFNGFSGEECGQCKRKANVLAGGPGWICTCGAYNAQALHGCQTPHESPDLGPSAVAIQEAYQAAEKPHVAPFGGFCYSQERIQ